METCLSQYPTATDVLEGKYHGLIVGAQSLVDICQPATARISHTQPDSSTTSSCVHSAVQSGSTVLKNFTAFKMPSLSKVLNIGVCQERLASADAAEDGVMNSEETAATTTTTTTTTPESERPEHAPATMTKPARSGLTGYLSRAMHNHERFTARDMNVLAPTSL